MVVCAQTRPFFCKVLCIYDISKFHGNVKKEQEYVEQYNFL